MIGSPRQKIARLLACLCVMLAAASGVGYGGLYAYVALTPIDPAPLLSTDPSPVLLDRNGAVAFAYLNEDDAWSFPLEESAPLGHIAAATIAVEDQRFVRHDGVDSVAVLRAAMQNITEQRIASGASTITMQLAKLEIGTDRSLNGKRAQALAALRLERRATKDEILRGYLNRAPYGGNLIGVEAAARRYFGKPTHELALHQAALLAALPKAPARYDPFAHPDRAMQRRDFVLMRMQREGFITELERSAAQSQPLGVAWHAYSTSTPHLAAQLESEARDAGSVTLTIDRELQDRVRKLTAHHLPQFNNAITNAAVIVADPLSGEILARVGSADFFESPGGQVDLAGAERSPGSALKPFVYARSMQSSLLYPEERLLDDSVDYGAYAPTNYDGTYAGLVTPTEALQHSLNVPAVMLVDRVGVAPLLETLRELGLSTLNHGVDHYGLGITLGNCGVRLDELAAAYAALANDGRYQPLRTYGPAGTPRAVYDAPIAAATMNLLEQSLPEEPDNDLVHTNTTRARIAWKTGTSTGHHDAWAVVFNRHYVVAVWLGNPDGTPASELVGATAALPLAGRIFRTLDPLGRPEWPDRSSSVLPLETCASSGLPAAPACTARVSVLYPRGQLFHRSCTVHQRQLDGSVLTRWPGSVRSWDLAAIDPIDGSSDAVAPALAVTHPADGAEIVMASADHANRIALRASADRQRMLHWYYNDRFYTTTRPGESATLALEVGEHRIACMSVGGEIDRVQFTVVRPETRQSAGP